MKQAYFIGLDTHGSFCVMEAVDGEGQAVQRGRCATNIAVLRAMLQKVPRPCHLVFEEGPLANWLYRNLQDVVDWITVSEPRRNRLISCEGDKDDPLDAAKLCTSSRSGHVKAVHQTQTLDDAVFKQLVAQYQRVVRRRVAAGQQITGLLKQHGVMARARTFQTEANRLKLLAQVGEHALLREMLTAMWSEYDELQEHEDRWRKRLIARGKQDTLVTRVAELPGVSWIRAAILRVYLDTPWRFRSKKALWKYLGIGLNRRGSGDGPRKLSVPWQVNRLLKSAVLGAARSAIAQDQNPFADQYRRWIAQGLSAAMAKRNVARSLSATIWGLWKNNTAYEPKWVGVNAASLQGIESSPKRTRV